MSIGLYDSFDPSSVYKVLQYSAPGLEYKTTEPNLLSLIESKGLRSKKNALKMIRRYYLKLDRKAGVEYFSNNYLRDLSIQYSLESIKPILLFTLICRAKLYGSFKKKLISGIFNSDKIDRQALVRSAIEKYGDRIVVKRAVYSYLEILKNFSLIAKDESWNIKKENCPNYILRSMILLFSKFSGKREINVQDICNEISFTYIDLSPIEDTLREFNTIDWSYQKRTDSKKIIIKTGIQ